MALGPHSWQKPRPTASVFVYLSPSGHVFNIAWQAMIKTYNISHHGVSECPGNVVRHFKVRGQFMKEEWFIAIKIFYLESSITRNICEIFFWGISRRFNHNQNETYRHWRQDGGWHEFSIVTHVTAWRRELWLTHPAVRGNHYSFAPKIHAVMLWCLLLDEKLHGDRDQVTERKHSISVWLHQTGP